MKNPKVSKVSDAELLRHTLFALFESPNEMDSNGEAANVVDGLYRIANAIHHLARAVEQASSPFIPDP